MKNPNRVATQRRQQARGYDGSNNPYDAIVIYNSANKSTMQYAKWISDELNCDVVPYSRKTLSYASLYKNVIFGGWIRASEITRLQMLRQNEMNFDLRSKNVIVFGVGIGPSDNKSYVNMIKERNSLLGTGTSLYLLPGRFDKSNLKGTSAASFKAMRDSMFDGLDDEATAIMKERFDNGYNGLTAEAIIPIVENVKGTAVAKK